MLWQDSQLCKSAVGWYCPKSLYNPGNPQTIPMGQAKKAVCAQEIITVILLLLNLFLKSSKINLASVINRKVWQTDPLCWNLNINKSMLHTPIVSCERKQLSKNLFRHQGIEVIPQRSTQNTDSSVFQKFEKSQWFLSTSSDGAPC